MPTTETPERVDASSCPVQKQRRWFTQATDPRKHVHGVRPPGKGCDWRRTRIKPSLVLGARALATGFQNLIE